jgi:hypothetical protein
MAHVIFDAFFLAMGIYVAGTWVRWFRSDARVVEPRWRAWMTVVGFALSNVSLLLIVLLSVHAAVTGGFPYYHPTLMLAFLIGFVTALAAIIAAIIGTGQLENPTFFCSVFCLLIWFASALAQ